MAFKPGDSVLSKAGRDKGKIFIVLSLEQPGYIIIADGDLRKIENPKRKKTRHVSSTGVYFPTIAEMIETGGRISNSDIRKALASVDKTV